jgi:hypothetical protein
MSLEIIRMVATAMGTSLDKTTETRIYADVCQAFGGERLYWPKLPKLQHQVRLSSVGTANPTASGAMALEIGRSVRQVRRIVRGR